MALTTVRSTGIGSLPAISGANLTSLNASNISSGTLNSARFSGGKILQCISFTQGSGTATSSTSFVNFGSMLVTITPSSTSSKILVMHSAPSTTYVDNTTNMGHVSIFRDSTNIAPHNSCFFQHQNSYATTIGANNAIYGETTETSTMEFLDSPSTTSAITYSLQYKSDNPTEVTLIFNCRGNGTGQAGSSVITAQEIAQ